MALSKLPVKSTAALLPWEPPWRETWERENSPPAQTRKVQTFFFIHSAYPQFSQRVVVPHWPCLCWDPSSVELGPPQACVWSLPLRTNWSLQTLQRSTTWTEAATNTWTSSSQRNHFAHHLDFWPVAVTGLCSSRPPCSLIGRGLWRPRDFERWHTGHSVVETLFNPSAIDHVLDTRDGQGCLGHVGGHNAQTSTRRRSPEHLQPENTQLVTLSCDLWPILISLILCVTLACCSGAKREYRGRT